MPTFNGAHEDVGHNRDADEAPQESDKVHDDAYWLRNVCLVNERENHAKFAQGIILPVCNIRRHFFSQFLFF